MADTFIDAPGWCLAQPAKNLSTSTKLRCGDQCLRRAESCKSFMFNKDTGRCTLGDSRNTTDVCGLYGKVVTYSEYPLIEICIDRQHFIKSFPESILVATSSYSIDWVFYRPNSSSTRVILLSLSQLNAAFKLPISHRVDYIQPLHHDRRKFGIPF